MLRICTAGSVDDGKSTLIGQLLFASDAVTQDKLAEIQKKSKENGLDYLDLSFLTDGLLEEREKHITIDVAYIYFSTKKRRFILADAPGHAEFTRNMFTAASQSQVAIIMVDVTQGIRTQTYRHLYIATLLRLSHIVFCVNKMDRVNFDMSHFEKIQAQLAPYLSAFPHIDFHWIPTSALLGDNVVHPSANIPSYKGKTLLNLLEDLTIKPKVQASFFQIQIPIQQGKFRGFAGKVASGALRLAQEMYLYPANQTLQISKLLKDENERQEVQAGESCIVSFENDCLAQRGDLLSSEKLIGKKKWMVTLCWMSLKPLQKGEVFYLRQGTFETTVTIISLISLINLADFAETNIENQLEMNDIAKIEIETAINVYSQTFEENPLLGNFILIDLESLHTVGAGFF